MKKSSKNPLKKASRKLASDNENGARKAIIEDLFSDFNRSRSQVYKMNFFRGIFFGFGSVLGGTVLVALLIWLLSFTGQLVPGVAGFIDQIIEVMRSNRR